MKADASAPVSSIGTIVPQPLSIRDSDPPEPANPMTGVATSSDIAIGRGENRGRTVRYTNALIGQKILATWDGGKNSVAITQEEGEREPEERSGRLHNFRG